MKKLFAFVAVFLAAIILLSACGNVNSDARHSDLLGEWTEIGNPHPFGDYHMVFFASNIALLWGVQDRRHNDRTGFQRFFEWGYTPEGYLSIELGEFVVEPGGETLSLASDEARARLIRSGDVGFYSYSIIGNTVEFTHVRGHNHLPAGITFARNEIE